MTANTSPAESKARDIQREDAETRRPADCNLAGSQEEEERENGSDQNSEVSDWTSTIEKLPFVPCPCPFSLEGEICELEYEYDEETTFVKCPVHTGWISDYRWNRRAAVALAPSAEIAAETQSTKERIALNALRRVHLLAIAFFGEHGFALGWPGGQELSRAMVEAHRAWLELYPSENALPAAASVPGLLVYDRADAGAWFASLMGELMRVCTPEAIACLPALGLDSRCVYRLQALDLWMLLKGVQDQQSGILAGSQKEQEGDCSLAGDQEAKNPGTEGGAR